MERFVATGMGNIFQFLYFNNRPLLKSRFRIILKRLFYLK